jgi:spore germination protein YaaH
MGPQVCLYVSVSLSPLSSLDRNYQSRLIIFPFPVLVNYVHEIKRLLAVNCQNENQLLSSLEILKTIPFSIELARETDIAYAVNALAKQSTFPVVSSTARDLTKKWKGIYSSLQATSPPPPPPVASSSYVPLVSTAHPPAESNSSHHDINRDSPQIKTWRALFSYCEDENTNIFHIASSKVSQAAASLKTGKRSTLSQMTIQQETDEKKKRRLEARMNELKMPTTKRRAINMTAVQSPVKVAPIIPLHEQKIQRR